MFFLKWVTLCCCRALVLSFARLSYHIIPWQTLFIMNHLLKSKIAKTWGRLLELSIDYSFKEVQPSFIQAFRDDYSFSKHYKFGKELFSSSENEKFYYVDITHFYCHNEQTGIQRRIYENMNFLLRDNRVSQKLRFVYFDSLYKKYRFATQLIHDLFPWAQIDYGELDNVCFHSDDVLLLMQCIVSPGLHLKKYHSQGLRIVVIIDDILPLQHPSWSSIYWSFRSSFRKVVRYASSIFSVSHVAASDIYSFITNNNVPHLKNLSCNGVYMTGCNFQSSFGISNPQNFQIPKELVGKKYILTVGTVEIRKNYEQALKAFDIIWKKRKDITYVMVGKTGFGSKNVERMFNTLKQSGENVFWFQGISDDVLNALYSDCLFVLNPSKGEGFGLLLIEAANHHKPVVAYDNPVFREILGNQAYYFSSDSPGMLSKMLLSDITIAEKGDLKYPDMSKIKCYTWEQSTKNLVQAIIKLC